MPTLTPDASSACTGIAELKSQRLRRANLRRKRDSPDRGTTSHQHAASWFAPTQRAETAATGRAVSRRAAPGRRYANDGQAGPASPALGIVGTGFISSAIAKSKNARL